MMVPKAGMVDILTELQAAGERDNGFTDRRNCVTFPALFSLSRSRGKIKISQILSANSSMNLFENTGLEPH